MEKKQRDLSYKSCTKCDRKFKRLEHLKRHERVHDDTVRFACTQCPKVFTRSDILRRHEAAHVAAAQSNDGVAVKRACLECAKSRERCSKGQPCQRCSQRGLCCSYPLSCSSLGASHRFGHGKTSPSSAFMRGSSTDGQTPAYSVTSRTSHQRAEYMSDSPDVPIDNYPGLATSTPQPLNIATVNSLEHIALQIPLDFSLNWLPIDESTSIDYESILGMDISSMGLFLHPQPENNFQEGESIDHTGNYKSAPTCAIASPDPRPSRERTHLAVRNSPAWHATPSQSASEGTSCILPQSTVTPPLEKISVGLYATSTNGARLPCTKRNKRHKHAIPNATPIKPLTDPRYSTHTNIPSGFPNTSHLILDDISPYSQCQLTREMYDCLFQQHVRFCVEADQTSPTVTPGHFPGHSTLNFFVYLYFENFDETIPIFHEHVADYNQHWLLGLAICTIGCHYTDSEEFSACVIPLHEMLRKCIAAEMQQRRPDECYREEAQIALTQARILNYIGMAYFGPPGLAKQAEIQRESLAEFAVSSGLLIHGAPLVSSEEHGSVEAQHSTWRAAMMIECQRRCGYAIWLLDCMAVYHFSRRPLISLAVTQGPLPQDALWATRNSQEWVNHSKTIHPDPPSLSMAVVQLFTKKHMAPDLGQFSRIILLHGVYREIFQLKDCIARPLSSWVPSVQPATTTHTGVLRGDSVTDSSLLRNWRNASLDCADVIHWAANETIAKNSGAEHPTVLHLHLARTLLLAPFEEIRNLCNSISVAAQEAKVEARKAKNVQQALEAERAILNWAQRDQYKARLAVLHCGCLFWHVRRYSCKAFYEPISVFLATLTLWAYSSYTSRPANSDLRMRSDSEEESSEPTSMTSDDQPIPTFIHLDRPNDDEMVQYFVLHGTPSVMRANITGVGDMYSSKGPARILKEGRKILASVSMAWGRTKEYVNVLELLERAATTHSMVGVDNLRK